MVSFTPKFTFLAYGWRLAYNKVMTWDISMDIKVK